MPSSTSFRQRNVSRANGFVLQALLEQRPAFAFLDIPGDEPNGLILASTLILSRSRLAN